MRKLTLYNTRTFYIMITVLMLVIGTVSYTLSSLIETNKQVKQDIQSLSRGSYDILLRPDQARSQLEQELNLVEENYVGVGSGGITIEQWQTIKDNPHVEIAAPVSSLGLFTSQNRTWMFKKGYTPKYFEVDYYTDDGVHTYKKNEEIFVYDFETGPAQLMRYGSSLEVDRAYLGDGMASFLFPPSYHQVVAIDPGEERKLTNYTFEKLNDRVVDYDSFNAGEFAIPILSLADVQVPNTITFSVDELTNPSESEIARVEEDLYGEGKVPVIITDPERYKEIIEERFIGEKKHNEVIYELVPDKGHSPFSQTLLYVDDQQQLRSDGKEGSGVVNFFSQRIGYQLDPVHYEIKDDKNLFVKQIGVNEEYSAPIYRDMKEVEHFEVDEVNMPLNSDEAFEFSTIGTFSIEENQDALVSSPLGIYGGDLPYLKNDPSKTIHPSAIAGSFVNTPAHGLISMDWASKIKGDAPIDAIRVKLAGLSGYDDEAVELIRQLESEWKNDEFTVDIVAGSSLQELTVDVEGIGNVVQNFTTLGAADTILSSWNILQIVLTAFYGLVAFTYIGFTMYNLLNDRKEDESLLAKLGWSQRQIKRTKYNEWSRMIGVPGIIIVLGYLSLGLLSNQWLPFYFSILLILLIVSLFLLVIKISNTKPKAQKRIKGSIAKQNIWFYRFHLMTASTQVIIMTVLTCFLPLFLSRSVEQTNQTRLGIFVHGEIEGLFTVIVVLLYALGLLTVYQSLHRLWISRHKEIELFLYLGWTNKNIRLHFMKEVMMWSLLSVIIGFIISLCMSFVFIDITLSTLLIGLFGLSMIMLLIVFSTVYSLQNHIKKGTKQYGY